MSPTAILIIDDDRLIRWSLATVLGRAGYRLYEAATGQEGLAAIERDVPDLILLDVKLPDMDGFAVLTAIHEAHPNLPVLMMTADATPETAQQALRLGARGYLDKPCDSAVLQAEVARALRPSTPPVQSNQ